MQYFFLKQDWGLRKAPMKPGSVCPFYPSFQPQTQTLQGKKNIFLPTIWQSERQAKKHLLLPPESPLICPSIFPSLHPSILSPTLFSLGVALEKRGENKGRSIFTFSPSFPGSPWAQKQRLRGVSEELASKAIPGQADKEHALSAVLYRVLSTMALIFIWKQIMKVPRRTGSRNQY